MNDAEHLIDKARRGDEEALAALLREDTAAAWAVVRGNRAHEQLAVPTGNAADCLKYKGGVRSP